MAEFNTPVDIGNRALQRVGSELIDSTQGFAENSKRAREVSFCYGKLRRAELQRNVWTFATVKTALRPIDTNTALLQPTLWDSLVTYFVGSIVEDAAGTFWESILRDNLGNDPQNTPSAWRPYFGPLTSQQFLLAPFFTPSNVAVSPSFTTTVTPFQNAFFNGELVHTIKGDGTYNVYRSLVDGNAVHPALPNQWSVDTRYKTDDVVNVYPAWSSGTTYSQGQTVLYTDGNAYSSLTNSNLNHVPPSSSANWSLMPTLTLMSEINPLSINQNQVIPGISPINEWDILANYSTGNFVIWNATIYLAIANSTGVYPSNAASWAACTGGTIYQSRVDFNQGNTPASSPTQWSTTFTLGGGNSLWIQIGGSAFPNGVGIISFQLTYPVGAGPLSQSWTKNVYKLPSNWLCKAPQDPKAGIFSWLGAPGNMQQTDWTYESGFLVTWDSKPIVYRFVADLQDVTKFPDMFCEALACRIALEVCEPLTQSTAKLQMISQMYKKFFTEAITRDQIEQGPITPPLDDLIATRL